jgi:hypothetical protein
MVYVVKYFRRLVRMKKLRKMKMQLSPKSGNVRSPLSDFGEHVWPDSSRAPLDLVRSGRIPTILAKSGRISGRIKAILARSGRL